MAHQVDNLVAERLGAIEDEATAAERDFGSDRPDGCTHHCEEGHFTGDDMVMAEMAGMPTVEALAGALHDWFWGNGNPMDWPKAAADILAALQGEP